MNKLVVSLFLMFCIVGFGLSGVNAKGQTVYNTLIVNKTYTVNLFGTEPGGYKHIIETLSGTDSFTSEEVCDAIANYGDTRCVWVKYNVPGRDMTTPDASDKHYWDEPVVKVVMIKEPNFGKMIPDYGVYEVTPLKAGSYEETGRDDQFVTKTQHKYSGDITYKWRFVNP
jgi:hypothetical protein